MNNNGLPKAMLQDWSRIDAAHYRREAERYYGYFMAGGANTYFIREAFTLAMIADQHALNIDRDGINCVCVW